MEDAYKAPGAALEGEGGLEYPLSRYVWRFTGVYVALSTIDAVLAGFDIDSPAILGILITAFSAWIAGCRFLKDNRRLPTVEERRTLVRRSLAVTVAVSTLAFSAVMIAMGQEERGLMLQPLSELPLWLWGLIVVLSLIISWAALAWGYGSMLERTARKQNL